MRQLFCALKVIGRQEFALQNTEPEFDLVQPGTIDWQPVDFDGQWPLVQAHLFLQPSLQLFRCMGGAIVQDQN